MQLAAPRVLEYVPGLHGVHAAVPPMPIPVMSLYVPTAQAVHAAPSVVPLYPAKHSQLEIALLPAAEFVPKGHAVQAPSPVTSL